MFPLDQVAITGWVISVTCPVFFSYTEILANVAHSALGAISRPWPFPPGVKKAANSVCVVINGKLLPEITMIWNVRQTRGKSEQKIPYSGRGLVMPRIDLRRHYLWALSINLFCCSFKVTNG